MHSGYALLLSFQTQKEQTVFILEEIWNAVATARKENLRAKV